MKWPIKIICYAALVLAAVTLAAALAVKISEKEPSLPENSNEQISFQLEPTVVPEYEIGVLEQKEKFIPTFLNVLELHSMEDIQKYLYTIDETAYVYREDLDLQGFVGYDLKTELRDGEPKILIFHTHSQEDYLDSREGNENDTIVGMGRKLAEILVNQYKVPVVHDIGQYDMENGKVMRGSSYEKMEPAIKKVLEKYPSVEITIDLHRDGVPDDLHLVTQIDGRQTAKIMFFNGVSRENKNGTPKELPSLFNPFIYDNMALSLQLQLTANELYPDFTRKLYIKPYRYSLHLMPKSMLIELGANTNTVAEAENALIPLAEILFKTLNLSE